MCRGKWAPKIYTESCNGPFLKVIKMLSNAGHEKKKKQCLFTLCPLYNCNWLLSCICVSEMLNIWEKYYTPKHIVNLNPYIQTSRELSQPGIGWGGSCVFLVKTIKSQVCCHACRYSGWTLATLRNSLPCVRGHCISHQLFGTIWAPGLQGSMTSVIKWDKTMRYSLAPKYSDSSAVFSNNFQ